MQTHFESTQNAEREYIIKLFNQYLKLNNCSNLILTSTGDYNSFDALCISALTTTLAIEYKRRNIGVFKYPDCIIEYPKWEALRKFHGTGMMVFYCIQYNDYCAIWCLSDLFNSENYRINPTHFFYWKDCTSTSDPDRYLHGERKKLVRSLDFNKCTFFLNSAYERLTFQQVNEYYLRHNLK